MPFTAANLVPGQNYAVIVPFTDEAGITHPAGETWRFLSHDFLPAADGLTLWVEHYGEKMAIRLQWLPAAQASLIEHFSEYVAPLPASSPSASPAGRHTRRSATRWLLIGGGILVLLVCLAAGGFGLYLMNALSYHPSTNGVNYQFISVSVDAPFSAKTGQPFELDVKIANSGDVPQTLDSIGLDPQYLAGAALDRTDPPFQSQKQDTTNQSAFTRYIFQRPIPAGGALTLRFYLTASAPGDHSSSVRVCINPPQPCTLHPTTLIVDP